MNNKKTSHSIKRLTTKLTAFILLFAISVQFLPVNALAASISDLLSRRGEASTSTLPSAGGIGKFDTDEEIAKLKQDFLSSIREDLLMKVDEYELTGDVSVILTFSDQSVIDSYIASSSYGKAAFPDYRESQDARKLAESLGQRQSDLLDSLLEAGLISEVKHTYVNILDGAFVSTTYEQLEAIYATGLVERITMSNTYNPQIAVENPVDVYETGIFNSGSVSYTGKGTLVAILDTGCDYTHTAFTSYTVNSPKYTRDDIEALIPKLQANTYGAALEAREVYYGNITGEKIVYGYDYADKDPDIMPFDNSHGTHVAGIIGGKDDTITGIAIDTQFAIMKVFSDYEAGAQDGDIIAALEDSIILGVDAINMSLGSSCGFTFESSLDEMYKNELYGKIEAAGISLIVAASNDYNSGFGGENGSTNKTDNPDSATVGSPSTYIPAMSVASIKGTKDYYMLVNGDREVFFTESSNMNGDRYDFFEILGIKEGERVTYEYVTVPGVGLAVNYSGIDVNGKIALVQRGEITFEEKVQYAQEAGALAVVIYNNIFGDISMTIGNYAKIPAVSIGKDDGEILAAQAGGTIVFDRSNKAGPFMSDFSSWGPTPDLKLKPEITAHGGNILSAVIGGYEEMSGTSMAAPNMCGITVLIRQYVMDKFPELSVTEVRDLVNRLCMSTATIALDKNGKPYSPRKQGAGIADILKSTTTDAYLSVAGINKTKLELGDDPLRSGVYTMSIDICNLSTSSSVSYRLGNITMTESVSTSDPEYVAQLAYILSPSSQYSVTGGEYADGVVTVAPGKTATVTVTITLSAEDKSYLNATFKNGMYVEGYLTFDNTDESGVDLNAPFLAFYGDWSEAPIFDLDYYEVETEAHDNAIDDDDKIKADYYATTPLGLYYYDYILPLGTYLYKMDETEYSPIPATREHAAISYFSQSISGLFGAYVGLLRGAKEMKVTITNTSTGEIVYEEIDYDCTKSHYYGGPSPYVSRLNIDAINFETGETFGANNTKYEVTMTATLDWDTTGNTSDTYSYSFYIDYEAPTVLDASFRKEYDKGREEDRYYLDVTVYDNHYVMSCRPVTVYELYMEGPNEVKRTYSPLSDTAIPVYQENRGEATTLTIEITDYLDAIADSDDPSGITLYLNDYALNSSLCYIPFPETDREDLEFAEDELSIDIHQTLDLAGYFVHKDTADAVNTDYLRNLEWSSSDESVVIIKGGKIEGLSAGSAVISVTSKSWAKQSLVGEELTSTPLYKSIVIHVSENVITDNPESSINIPIEELKFNSYKTLFAFNNDIDYSAIGRTDSINYFGNSNSIEFYPSEKIQLYPQLSPWNISKDRYEFKWTSSNPNVASVDQDGIVTAESEGKARITLNIIIDGKQSLLAARITVEVKSEFIIKNRTLVAYKGKGGDVVIPDDEGIIYIGSYAFCHFYLDNEKEVEKDENGYYDIDEKKTPYGNTTVTSVVIPEGVETVQKYAFYNCDALSRVILPETCETIGAYAFANSEILEDINLDNVNIISSYAFYNCESLSCEGIGGIDLSNVYTMGDYAFAKTAIDNIKLSRLSRVGVGIFSECSSLRSVELGKRTRISQKMFEKTAIESIEIFSDTVADEAFLGCDKLRSLTLTNNVTYLGKQAFKDCRLLSSVTFEGDVEQISDYAFANCTSLKEFTLPNSKLKIGNAIFSDSGLKKLTFTENTEITDMGISVFDKISGVTVDVSASSLYERRDDVIYTKDGKTLMFVLPVIGMSSFTVPAEIERISDGAFTSASTIISVDFESGSKLEKIGKYAFAFCPALISIDLPDNTLIIDDYAFYAATSLTNIDLSKVSYIGDGAFAKTSIEEANITFDGVHIGANAFVECSRLKKVTLGKNAFVGSSAFNSLTALKEVDLLGDATISEAVFAQCSALTSFDFADIVTPIGNYAFFNCARLTQVVAPKLTGIGIAAFADCYRLSTFTAPSLKTIGERAFALHLSDSKSSNLIVSLDLPELESIGDSAFVGCKSLRSLAAPKLKSIGKTAFATCDALQTITFSSEYTEVEHQTFYGCASLEGFDFSHIVTIGDYAFTGAARPAALVLNNVERIGSQAFVESETKNMLVSLTAPKLTVIGEMAFAGCTMLTEVYAPVLEKVGGYAFVASSIEEFEVFPTLKEMDDFAFSGAEKLKAFYVTVNGTKTYDHAENSVMIKGGALYLACKNGYALFSYPTAKDSEEYAVADGTTRIEIGAFMDNTFITKVSLPSSLRAIGNFAFYGCESLNTVEFNSYYAPVLEGTLTGSAIDVNINNVDSYPGFDKLYRYDYYYFNDGKVYRPFYYRVFVDVVGTEKAQGLTAILPDNCEGYDSLIYDAYFTPAEERSGITTGKFAIAFMDAVNALPDVIDRFDTLLINDAILAFNALEAHTDEIEFVDESFFTRFYKLRRDYNIDVVTDKIAHLFDIDNSEYSFNLVKDARAAFLALTDEERASISNASTLDQKISDLAAAIGKDIDFSLSYADHVPEQKEEDENPPSPPQTSPTVSEPDDHTPIVLIISAAALVVIAAAVTVCLLLIKKNRSTKQKTAPVSDQASEGTSSENDQK